MVPNLSNPEGFVHQGCSNTLKSRRTGCPNYPKDLGHQGCPAEGFKGMRFNDLEKSGHQGCPIIRKAGRTGRPTYPQGIRALGVSDGMVQVQPVHQPRIIWSPGVQTFPWKGAQGAQSIPEGTGGVQWKEQVHSVFETLRIWPPGVSKYSNGRTHSRAFKHSPRISDGRVQGIHFIERNLGTPEMLKIFP